MKPKLRKNTHELLKGVRDIRGFLLKFKDGSNSSEREQVNSNVTHKGEQKIINPYNLAGEYPPGDMSTVGTKGGGDEV